MSRSNVIPLHVSPVTLTGQDALDELTTALVTMPDGLCMIDADGRLILCNPAFAAMYDLPPELTQPGTARAEIVQFCVTAFGAPLSSIRQHLSLSAQIAADQTLVGEYQIHDGRWVRVSHTKIADGSYVAIHEEISRS